MTPSKKAQGEDAPTPDPSSADPADEWTTESSDDSGDSSTPVGPTDAEVDASRQAEADRINAELEAQRLEDEERQRTGRPEDEVDAEVEPAEPGSAPGPRVIDGPFGTTVDSTDPSLGTLRVEVKSNVMLGNQLRTVGQKVSVPDDAESRGAIAVGHLELLGEDDELNDELDYEPF